MTAMELIETYNISLCERLEWGKGLVPDGRIKVGSLAKAQKDGAIDMIKTKKPEIMSVLLARRDARIQAEAERQARIDAIPGLAEIRAATSKLRRGQEEPITPKWRQAKRLWKKSSRAKTSLLLWPKWRRPGPLIAMSTPGIDRPKFSGF